MFNKRKKARELEAQQLAYVRAHEQKKYDEAIQAACELEDPAARVLALRGVEKEILAKVYNEQNEISKTAKRKAKKIDTIGGTVTTAGGIAALTLIAGPVAWVGVPIILVGGMGVDLLTSKREKALKAKFQAASADYVQNMAGLGDLVSEIIKVTVTDNVEGISKSPLRKDVLQLPGVKEIFAAEAARKIAAAKEASEAKVEPPVEEKKPAPRPRRDPNYKDLGQTGL